MMHEEAKEEENITFRRSILTAKATIHIGYYVVNRKIPKAGDIFVFHQLTKSLQ